MTMTDFDDDVDFDAGQHWWHAIEHCDDPWRDWLQQLDRPGAGPLDAWLEQRIEDMIRAANAQRLAKTPTTKHFTEIWAKFKEHHVNLDGCYEYRCDRYLTWRAAALTVICDGEFQDQVDAAQAHTKLAETMGELGPYDADGSHRVEGGEVVSNFWRQINVWKPSANDQWVRRDATSLTEYAAMVLTLMKASRGAEQQSEAAE